MPDLVYDICYYDTYSDRKIVVFRDCTSMDEAVHCWAQAQSTIGRDLTLKPFILPKYVSREKYEVCQRHNGVMSE